MTWTLVICSGCSRQSCADAPHPATAAMLEHIHATIRAAVNAAVRERLIGDDPARYVELPPARRPHAVVRTDDQIRLWRRTGVRPVVATWTLPG